MTENNRFIKKFDSKSKFELEHYTQNPSKFEPLAVDAAKYILDTKDFNAERNENENQELIKINFEEPIFKEKAFFINKWIYRLSALWLFGYTIIYLFIAIYKPSFYSIFWTLICGISFLIIITKQRKTITFLKQISALALIVLGIQYLIYFTFNYDLTNGPSISSILFKDIKLILILVLTFFTINQLIENKTVRIN